MGHFLNNPHEVMKKTKSGLLIGDQAFTLDGGQAIERMKNFEKINKGAFKSDQEIAKANFEDNIERANKKYEDAMNAPIPKIGLLGTTILLRACPIKQVMKGNLIVKDDSHENGDLAASYSLEGSVAYSPVQEILVIGDAVGEHYPELKVGMTVRINEKNFLAGSNSNYQDKLFYDIPRIVIEGHEYIHIQAYEIAYYLK